jgi:hypothetical protein
MPHEASTTLHANSVSFPSPRVQTWLPLAFTMASAFVFLDSPGTTDVRGRSASGA